jgi:hypothetical protein
VEKPGATPALLFLSIGFFKNDLIDQGPDLAVWIGGAQKFR